MSDLIKRAEEIAEKCGGQGTVEGVTFTGAITEEEVRRAVLRGMLEALEWWPDQNTSIQDGINAIKKELDKS